IFVAGGVSNPQNDVNVIEKSASGEWSKITGFKLAGNEAAKTCISGLALSADGSSLFVLNTSDKCLYVLDAASGAGKGKVEVGDHPGVCKLSKGGNQLYVTCWGAKNVAVVDVTNPAQP